MVLVVDKPIYFVARSMGSGDMLLVLSDSSFHGICNAYVELTGTACDYVNEIVVLPPGHLAMLAKQISAEWP